MERRDWSRRKRDEGVQRRGDGRGMSAVLAREQSRDIEREEENSWLLGIT